jgi:hypothetical protein
MTTLQIILAAAIAVVALSSIAFPSVTIRYRSTGGDKC